METTIVDKKTLRQFGLILSFIWMAIFGTVLPFIFNKPFVLWPWVLGGIFLFPSLLNPLWLKYFYVVWMKVGHLLGWVNTRIILSVIFFCLITPWAMIMRLCGKDPMQRQWDKEITSYRKNSVTTPISHMEKPF
jgi:hypothetical protein